MEKNNIIFEGKYALSLSLLPHVPEPPFIQTIALPIEIIGMERVVEYMLKSSKKTLTSTSYDHVGNKNHENAALWLNHLSSVWVEKFGFRFDLEVQGSDLNGSSSSLY